MANTVNLSADVESCLRLALKEDTLKTFDVEIDGNTEKGDGYVGDVIFVSLTGQTATGSSKAYDLVLKCGKRNAALRENAPVKDIFLTEICMYKTIFPALKTFQENKRIEDVFDSVPKCYGTHVGQNVEVLALNNLRKLGYELFDRKKPLTTRHMHLVLKEYGKWHATSAAFLDQHPKEFNVAAGGLMNMFQKIKDVHKMYAISVEQVAKLLDDEFDEVTRMKWKNLCDNIEATIQLHKNAPEGFTVISHGDCWNNNYMYKNDQNGLPLKVAMLDWQYSKPCNPVFDLSYFVYCCVSEEDLKNFDGLLRVYHDSLSSHLQKLGSSPILYPFSQLMLDWSKLGRTGVAQAAVALKLCLVDMGEVPDVIESVEQGQDFLDAFHFEMNDPKPLKYRMKYIIDHAVERNYI